MRNVFCGQRLSSNRARPAPGSHQLFAARDPFTQPVGGRYILVVPAAVGRPGAYDAMEFERSVETLQSVADLFMKHDVKAAIEPIRAAETSLTHTRGRRQTLHRRGGPSRRGAHQRRRVPHAERGEPHRQGVAEAGRRSPTCTSPTATAARSVKVRWTSTRSSGRFTSGLQRRREVRDV